MVNQTVILWSYRRPEMTMNAIKRLLDWPNLQKLLVSIDGPRVNASSQELAWRKETIAKARIMAESNSRVDVKAWDINEGSTAHGYRTISREFELVDSVISIEEDNQITNEGLDFLTQQVYRSPKPLIASAYSRFWHNDLVQGIRYTNFPEQWGISMNSTQFGFYQKVIQERKVRLKKIRHLFQETYYQDSIYCELLSQFWFHHYNNMVMHPDYGDGLISYSAVEAGIRYMAPWRSYVSDLGHLDLRAMHPRNEAVKMTVHDVEGRYIDNEQICLRCEKDLNQMKGLGIRPILGGYSFRLRKFFSV